MSCLRNDADWGDKSGNRESFCSECNWTAKHPGGWSELLILELDVDYLQIVLSAFGFQTSGTENKQLVHCVLTLQPLSVGNQF